MFDNPINLNQDPCKSASRSTPRELSSTSNLLAKARDLQTMLCSALAVADFGKGMVLGV